MVAILNRRESESKGEGTQYNRGLGTVSDLRHSRSWNELPTSKDYCRRCFILKSLIWELFNQAFKGSEFTCTLLPLYLLCIHVIIGVLGIP